MTAKTDYIIMLEDSHKPLYYADPPDHLAIATTTPEAAKGFNTIEEAIEVRNKCNNRWKCGAVIRARRVSAVKVEVVEVW